MDQSGGSANLGSPAGNATGQAWTIQGTTPDVYGNVTAINNKTGQLTTGPLSYFQNSMNA
jgi:hypothetical protein